MKKILLLLLLAGGLLSQLEAKCTRSDIANLRAKGFSNSEIGRICGISHHTKHKKRKKHHRRAGGRVQWINLEDKQCSRYLANSRNEWGDTGCLVTYKKAQRICSAVGGRVPSLNDFKRVAAKCNQSLRRTTVDIGNATNACYHRNGVDTYMGHIYWTRTTIPHTDNKYVANLSQNVIGGRFKYSNSSHVICVK